jgi:predicted ATPase
MSDAARLTVEFPWYITEIIVNGFKSIGDRQSIEIRPLTILAGANSSGKSSIMQPLLLLKQTLEASYDPGPLLLNGANVHFTSADQLLAKNGKSKNGKSRAQNQFEVGVRLNNEHNCQLTFRNEHLNGFRIEQMSFTEGAKEFTVWQGMSETEIVRTGLTEGKDSLKFGHGQGHWEITREKCFLELTWSTSYQNNVGFSTSSHLAGILHGAISDVIHLPGLSSSFALYCSQNATTAAP